MSGPRVGASAALESLNPRIDRKLRNDVVRSAGLEVAAIIIQNVFQKMLFAVSCQNIVNLKRQCSGAGQSGWEPNINTMVASGKEKVSRVKFPSMPHSSGNFIILLCCLAIVYVARAEFSFIVVGDWGSGGGPESSFATTQKV